MALTVDELLRTLKKSRLLSEKQLSLVEDGVRRAQEGDSAKPLTPEAVTKKLVREKLITDWHAKMLLQKQSSFHVGQYVLQKAIGRGGMGKVFKALDRKNKRDVAIKVLSGKMAKKPKLVARFRREVEVASQIDSPYIVRAFDAGEVGKSHFMVMEYVEGESIEEVADRLGRLRTGHACEITRQAALGLKFAHEQGMVHRDIKPANMMIAFEDDDVPIIRLLDMGLARFEKADNDGMTRTGQVMGTPDYMAPEQGWNTADVDIRADIYSLGCTLFRLVTGQVPFPGDNPLQVLMARCSSDAPLASSLVPDLDPRVDAIIRRMTWRDPSQRYQTPDELIEAVSPLCIVPAADDLAEGTGLEAPPAAPTMMMDSTQQEPSFQGFLRDVGSGADVTLMQNSFEGLGASMSGTLGSSGSQSGVHRAPQQTQPTKKWPLLAAGALIVALFVLSAIILFPPGGGPGQAGPDVANGKGPIAPPPPPRIDYFADIAVQRVQAGQIVGFFAAPEIQDGLQDVTWELGEDAPAGAEITPANGSFYWSTPVSQPPGRVEITLLAKRGDETAATQIVAIDIQAAPLNAKIIEFANLEIASGQPWEHQLRLFGVDEIPPDAKFVLAGDPPDGLQLDEETGVLTWTPPKAVFGQIPISLQLIDRRSERIVHNAACSVMVKWSGTAATPRRVLNLPPQTAVVGQMLAVNLRANRELPKRIRWELAQGSLDKGATLDAQSGRFEWTPGKDMVGQHEFDIRLKRDQQVTRVAVLTVRVAAGSTPDPSTMTNSLLPDADAAAAAEKEIRQVFKREFASRSSLAKRDLSLKLLLQSYADKSEAMQFSLLKLAFDVAESSRAYGCGCEALQQLQERFGVDSVANAVELVDGFRTRSVSKVDLALLGECMFREGLKAANAGRFESASRLMKVANTIARKGAYAPVTERALELLKALPDEDAASASQREPLGSKQQLAADELSELLTRYQFQPIFQDADAVRYVRSTEADPGAGRDLWTFTKSGVSLRSEAVDLVTGFIEPRLSMESFVLRMHVKADTTAAVLVFGASGAGQTGGYQIPLVGAMEFSVTQAEPESVVLAKAQGRVVHDKSGWDLVELAVMGKKVAISVNGSPVTEAQLAAPVTGTVGIITNLRQPGEHQIQIRHIRLLETPEN